MMQFDYPEDATPLDPDETADLIPGHITNHDQLNEFEAANILQADEWLFSNYHRNFLNIDFIKLLHKKMFDETWRWAGKFRVTEKNIGVTPSLITTELKKLLEDVIHQIRNNSYPGDEIAYRFHHRLVKIHPFANGNGRHARLMTDLLLIELGRPKFSWGNKESVTDGSTRKQYIEALKKADQHDYCLLAVFVRS